MGGVDVVIPVYRGYRETVACIESVLATTDSGAQSPRIVLVNDCSPEPELADYLSRLAAVHERVVLLVNETNLGFVATANRGMAYDGARDVLLLNSDVEVAGDWLQRLREAAYSDAAIASVTPFSNNATLCSFPDICRENPLLYGLDCASIDRHFAALFSSADLFDIPTGVGCCMYLRRDCLDAVGLFDEATFGRGYGEENDWCQRAANAGWRNVQLPNCFVYHHGGVSFAAEQDPRIAAAMEILDRRYPHYHRAIQDFIADDPARPFRIAALLDIVAGLERPKVAFVSHKLGGGAQQHVDELAALYRERALCLQITPVEDGRSVSLTFFDRGQRLQDGLYFEMPRHYPRLVALLRALGVGRVHFHHTMGVHPRLWLLAQDLGCHYDLTVHDYYLVNGNPTLTDADARYVGEEGDIDGRCAEHYPLPPGVSASDWRENQRLLVENAARVIFPSADCRRRFMQFYPVSEAVAAWHPDYTASQPYPEPQWRYTGGRPLKVLVLGAISREKGADILEQAAVALRTEQIEFHLLGYAYRALSPTVITHGPYASGEAYELVAAIAPDVVWFPACWPETYSYTLSVALHMGLPVVIPDIGAFSERVRGRAHSSTQPWDMPLAGWVEFWRRVQADAALPRGLSEEAAAVEAAAVDTAATGFYNEDYLAPVPPRSGEIPPELLGQLQEHFSAALGGLSRRERVLAWVWRLSRTRLFARLLALVPFRYQRALKRRLSSRPMHEIVRTP